MNVLYIRTSRRAFLGTLALGAGAFAEGLTRTPTTCVRSARVRS